MTCYLRLHEIAVAVHADADTTDWDECLQIWRAADGVAGRDLALDAMPVTAIDLDDLPTAELTPFAGLILAGRSDQGLLAAMHDTLRGFLDKGRVVVFSGQLTHDWLPGATAFEPGPAVDVESGPPQLGEHPIFNSVSPHDLGTNFIYSNGRHRPPAGADVIAQRADGMPGAYVDRTSTGGTVLLHGGTNLLANATTDSSAARIAPQLIEWVRQEARR
ncbi:MAG: phosphate starvation-inducible protein PhoH [Actinomycetota bacterium]|nr:phosphate starvation-inducible protein PhoH [Actinomycetota bacterium]